MGFFGRKKKVEEQRQQQQHDDDGLESKVTGKSVGETTATSTTTFENTNDYKYVELGTIDYVNITKDGKHGDYDIAMKLSLESGKPIFANFVEWSGWQGCKDAGKGIFADPLIKRVVEEFFVPCAFNTWDRNSNSKYSVPMKVWGAGLQSSWWGYLRIINVENSSRGNNGTKKPSTTSIVSGTRQITSSRQLDEVKLVICEALEDLGYDVPDYMM